MSDKLFKKIIGELESINYTGRIALFSNNEPLLDDRILDFSEYARKKLPKARIHMYTNGTLLKLEMFLRLIDNVDELVIDNYSDNLSMITTVSAIHEYCINNPELISKVTIMMRKSCFLLRTLVIFGANH